MCTSAITIQKHKHKEGGTLSQEFGFMLNQDSTDAIQVKKDWTGDNSCPYEVRSKYFVVVNYILYTNEMFTRKADPVFFSPKKG